MLATKAVAFVMLPIYTRFLTPSDYGVLQLVTMILEVVTIFAGSRIAYGVFHFYHKAPDEEQRRAVLSTALLLLAATFGVAALTAWSAAPFIARLVFHSEGAEYATYIRLAVTAMAFEGLIGVPLALIQLRSRSQLFVAIGLLRLSMQVILNLILLVRMDLGVTGVLIGSLATNALFGSVLAASMLREVGIRFSSPAARSFLRFGLPLVGMQVATFVLTFGDRYFLNRAGDAALVGLYGLAYQFGFLVATVGFAPFQRVWDPQRFAIAKRPDRDPIFARAFVYLNLAVVSAALGIALFAGDVLRVIAAPDFHAAAAFVPVIVAAYVFYCWSNFLNIGIYIRERTEYYTIANWAAAAVALGGYILLIPSMLAWGAAIATLASLMTRAGLAYFFSQRLWPVRYDWSPVLRLSFLAVITCVVSELLPPLTLLISFAAHAALLCAYAALVWFLVLSDAHRAGAAALLGRLRGRRGSTR